MKPETFDRALEQNDLRDCDVNAVRLRNFIDLAKEAYPGESEDQILRLDEELQNVIKKITMARWLPADQERRIISALCRNLHAWPILLRCGEKSLSSVLSSLMPVLPDKFTSEDLVMQIPAMSALFLTHLSIYVTKKEGNQFALNIEFREGFTSSPVDLIFLEGLIQGLFRIFNISQVTMSLDASTMQRESWPLEKNPATSWNQRTDRYLLQVDSPRSRPGEKSDGDGPDKYAQSVLRRAAELLQDRRDLMTAVEYLNVANDQLEKQILANKRELSMARNIQKGFVPSRVPDWKGLQFWVKFYPLTEVSGDFYDYFSLGSSKFGLVVCDVSGHGVPAALISAIAKISFTNHRLDSPSEVFGKVNFDLINHVKMEGYLTSFYMIIDNHYNILYSMAASPAPVLYRARTGEVEVLPGAGTLLGMFPDANKHHTDLTTRLEPGDKLFVFTDGLIEAANTHDEIFGMDRLIESVRETKGMDVQHSSEHVLESVNKFILGSDQRDDLTLITVMLSERVDEYDTHVQKAREAFHKNDLKLACEELKKAIFIFPRHTPTLFLLGRYLAMSGDYAEAAEYITQYNSLKPYNADAFIILGYCSYRTGNYQLARDHFNRSLSLRNENPTALYNLARTCLKLGLTQEARSTYETLAKNHPAYGALPRLKSLFS